MHKEIAESLTRGTYEPKTGRLVELAAPAAGAEMRARARAYEKSAPAESADLAEAAAVLEADGGRFTVDFIDAARLLGPTSARRLPRKE